MLWGGRFAKAMDEQARRFNDSLAFDQRLYAADIQGSIAYAHALLRAGLLTSEECEQIIAGLKQVRDEFDRGTLLFHPQDEDIHTAVERRLTELIGPVAGKLHTGRSRNDQVSTDLRLYLMDQMASLGQHLGALQRAVLEKAEAHLDVIKPGYTHLQPAQPVLFSHWLMSFFWKFQRDRERLADVARRTAVLPLGAGALAGNPFDIDRQALADELGFAALAENSMDAVSDRDYVVEFLSWAALLQVHLSNLAEDLILWSSREFGFVELDDAYCTGSSLMPQKKNPDTLELMRGKSGRIVGHLTGSFMMLKGLPSGYNKDLQEDKEALFDTVDTLSLELPLAAGIISTLKVNAARMASALDEAMLATDLADYLERKGVPFRKSHHLVGQAVKRAEELGTTLRQLDLAEYQAIHPAFAADLYAVFDYHRSVERRDVLGGTAPAAVRLQISRARALLDREIYHGDLRERKS
ncbi:MAG: argininosuccinate lyase [Chloroflexi bacterium]|nr:argininosuccinate lyase [Chloroflexota bacterium]